MNKVQEAKIKHNQLQIDEIEVYLNQFGKPAIH